MLDRDVAWMIPDKIRNSVFNLPYTRLKERLLALLRQPSKAKLRCLLRGQIDTSGWPTRVLAQIRAFAMGYDPNNSMIRLIFMEQMPMQTRRLSIVANKPPL